MSKKQDVIACLSGLLRNELTAVNQYFLHARMLKNWGFMKLADHEYKESIEEMRHADALIERILFLGGIPDPQKMQKVTIGQDVPQILAADLALEKTGYTDLVEAMAVCEKGADHVSRELVQKLLTDTEEHADYLETQLALLEKIGLQNYLTLQI